MISGAHYSIMTDKELDFSDKQHEAALQALIKGGAVEVVLDENGSENFASLKSVKLTRRSPTRNTARQEPERGAE